MYADVHYMCREKEGKLKVVDMITFSGENF